MSDDKKVIDISHIKKKRDKQKHEDICIAIVELHQRILKESEVPSDIRLHFCSELGMMMDFFKKKLDKK